MDSKDRDIKILRAIQKEYSASGDAPFNIDDFISTDVKNLGTKAFEARDLYGESAAENLLRKTGVSVPDWKTASTSEKEKFFGNILAENSPLLKQNVMVDPDLLKYDKNTGKLVGNLGEYYPGTGLIKVSDKRDLIKSLSDFLHELGHSRDDQIENRIGITKEIDKTPLYKHVEDLKSGKVKKVMGGEEAYKAASNLHHLKIPGRMKEFFEKSALDSILKGNKIKSVLPGALTAGAAAMAGSASDALADVVVPGGVEGVGEGSDKLLSDSQERDVELSRDATKDDKLTTSRLKALQRMLGK
jgi:hypothetical protein